jgi:hypothetical protein
MNNKKKLSLTSIKVHSFVTELEKSESQTVKGGGDTDNPVCFSTVPACFNTHTPFCTNFPSAYDACPTVRGCTLIDVC